MTQCLVINASGAWHEEGAILSEGKGREDRSRGWHVLRHWGRERTAQCVGSEASWTEDPRGEWGRKG